MSRFLRDQYSLGRKANFGYWLPKTGVQIETRIAAVALPHILAADEKRDTVLWPFLFRQWPNWKWGLQGTGDCVSWMVKHRLDVLLAVLIHCMGKRLKVPAQVVQEAVYGFARVERYGRPDYGGAGTYGSAAADAVQRFGILLRQPYDGHNLTRYSGQRAIEWGRTGVPDELEPFAAEHKIRDRVAVTDCESAGALVQAGYPVDWCGYTSWGVERDADGFARRFASGAHAVTISGVRYGRRPGFWVANTGHGDHVSGPVGPFAMPSVYAQCGSWVDWDRCERVFRAGDCFACSFVEGFPLQAVKDLGTGEYL